MNASSLLGLNGLNANVLPMLSCLGNNLNLGLSFQSPGLLTPLRLGYDQIGPVHNGPGSLQSHQPFMLMQLEKEQSDAIERAKQYAREQSIKSVLEKQSRQQQLQQTPFNQKAQTLNLLSRIYVGSISYDLKEEAIKMAFQIFGPIRSVSMSWDAATQKHKGFAFIEFEFPESANLSSEQMNAISLGGRQLKVGRPSNLPNADSLINDLVTEHNLQRRIFVSGVHADLTEDDLSLVFEAFGKISYCKLNTGQSMSFKHRGFGYIEYDSEQSANDAVASMNMFDLGGQLLRVCKAITPPEDPIPAVQSGIPSATIAAVASASAKVMASEIEHVKNGRSPESSGTGVGESSGMNIPSLMGSTATEYPLSWDRIEAQESETVGQSDFGDEDDGGTLENQENFHISGRDARNVIMQKLLRPTRGVLILRNMVGPDDCDDELETEVGEECGNFGSVERVVIYQELDNNQLSIKIFVVFHESDSVDNAVAALNGRYFAGRQVIAERYDKEKFEANDLTG